MAKKGLHINVYRVPGGIWRCDLKLNTTNGGEGLTIRGTSEIDETMMMGSWWTSVKGKLSKAGLALSKAKTIAKGILSNPALAQAFPQYVAPALVAISAIEQAEKHGKLPELKKQLTDPTLKKFAREMDEMSKGQRTAMSGGGMCLACDTPPSTNVRGMRGYATIQQQQQESKEGPNTMRPFGLPTGNPHPFAQSIRQQLWRGVNADPLMLQKLARMTAEQRRIARLMR